MFADRADAGKRLARRLERFRNSRPVVVALVRGGVPVGYQVARALGAPLDVLVVRKLGAPGQPELAIGAVTDGGEPHVYWNEHMVRALDVSVEYRNREASAQWKEVRLREAAFRRDRPPVPLAGRVVILVDDGIATGATVEAALRRVQSEGPARVVLAVPVAARDSLDDLRTRVDECVCLQTPEPFVAVGEHYDDFRPVLNEDVIQWLDRAREETTAEAVRRN